METVREDYFKLAAGHDNGVLMWGFCSSCGRYVKTYDMKSKSTHVWRSGLSDQFTASVVGSNPTGN